MNWAQQVTQKKHKLNPSSSTEDHWVKWFHSAFMPIFYVLVSILNFSNKVFWSLAICKTESDLRKARLAPTGLVAFPLHAVAVSPKSSAVTAACFFSLATVLNFTNISKISLLFKLYLPKWLEIWNFRVVNPERLFDNYKCPTLGTSNLPIRPAGMSMLSPRNWLI